MQKINSQRLRRRTNYSPILRNEKLTIRMDPLPSMALGLIQALPAGATHSLEAIHSLDLELKDLDLVASILKIYLELLAMLRQAVKEANGQDLVVSVPSLFMLEMTSKSKLLSALWMRPKASPRILISPTWSTAVHVVDQA